MINSLAIGLHVPNMWEHDTATMNENFYYETSRQANSGIWLATFDQPALCLRKFHKGRAGEIGSR